jgi:signal transduction histidine kinase
MVSDLLEFARLSRTEIALESVVIQDALLEVTAALHAEIQQARARLHVEVPDGLTVRAHRQTFVQALTNLVSNAVKFVRPGEAPVVRIAATQTGAMVRVTVADEGIGIAPAAQARIFNVFERLHSEEEYPGTGIGLAIVKKGVERMGGSVAVESKPGNGATFAVDLPAPPEPA